MAFNGSSNFTVESAINIVHRDQHIQNINFQIGRTEEQRQVERKEDGLELIDQYREILHGDIYKVEKTGSTWEEDRDAQFGNKCTGRRTYYRARIYGDDKVYTGVIYSGRDASKLWKEDFAKYSGSHDLDDSAMIWQLHRINRSKVPALIFYDEWLPMAHFCPNEANIFTIMYAQLLAKYLHCHCKDIWLNSQSGQFSSGPEGPFYSGGAEPRDQYIVKDLCSTADMLRADICLRFLSKPSLNLDQNFLHVAAFSQFLHNRNKCPIQFFDIEHHCTPACSSRRYLVFKWCQSNGDSWQQSDADAYIHNKYLDFLDNLRFDTIYSARQCCEIARIARGFVLENTYNNPFPLYDPKLVRGMTRFSSYSNSRWPGSQSILRNAHSKEYQFGKLGKTWLSRAHHHFGCGVDHDGIENCYYMTFYVSIRICGPPSPPTSSSEFLHDQHADGQDDHTIYLFIQPLTRLSEVEDWLNSKPFFWSFDENGTTHIPESTCAQLGLPTLTLSEPAGVRFELWPKYTYDAVYKWQVAKGFDPSTLDFARSLGVPIFDDDRLAEESQFKEVVKEEQENPTESESPNTSDVGGSFMSRLTTSASRWFQPEAAPGIPVL